MSGYLDAYGVDDARREKNLKWIAASLLAILIATAIAYFVFRNWGEKQRAKQFLKLVHAQNYRAAYEMWGCSDANPCRDYSMERFMEDWGPRSAASQLHMGDTETCGTGLLVNLNSPGKRESTLLVETETGVISYAPWPECPEQRFRLMKWLRMKFGKEPAPAAQ